MVIVARGLYFSIMVDSVHLSYNHCISLYFEMISRMISSAYIGTFFIYISSVRWMGVSGDTELQSYIHRNFYSQEYLRMEILNLLHLML